MDIIEELKQINVNLNFAVEFRDGLVVRSEIKKIDALILKLSENLNGETLESRKELIDFAEWYSGMDRSRVDRAYERYLREKIN
jgi:hypothetical protein